MRSLALLLLLAACLASGSRAFDLLDPSDVVEALTTGQGAGVEAEKWKRPEFCGEMDCPPYKRKERTDNWEMRRYESGKWVVTNVSDSKFELAYTKAASRLLKYFKGSNSEKQTFDVTTPTLAELKLEKGGKSSKRDYAFSLWLPEELQKDTPQPTEADLQIIEFPSIDVYVRVFGGFATEGTILEEANGLMDMLDEEGRDFGGDVVWAAVYDPPQKLMKRHNEVHVPVGKKQEQAVPAS